MIIVNGFEPLTIITKHSILDVAAVLDPPLETVNEVQNRKSEHHYSILDIRINLGTKFQLKLTVLICWTKFAPKGCFRSKIENVNTTIEFCIFELVCNNSQNI